ncbi:MFS transporter [Halorhabdus tiamatea]|nr:MFS transporter [Halorhabdus tiamatea]
MSSAASTNESSLVVSLVGGSHVVNHMYFMLLPPIFGALKADLGVSDPQAGAALGLVGVVVTALQLPLGYVADAYSRTAVLGLSLSMGALGAALTATATSYPWLLVAAAVTGLGIAGHHPAHYPLLAAATDPSTRGRAYSVHGFTGVLGFAAPPAIVGGASALGFDWRVAIGAIAAVGGIYGVVCLMTFRRAVSTDVTHPDPDQRPEDGLDVAAVPSRAARWFQSVLSSPAFVLLGILWFLTSVAAWGIKAYTAPLLSGTYGVADGTANLVVAAMLTTGALLIFLGGWLSDRVSAGAVLLVGYVALIGVAGLLAWGALPTVAALGVVLVLSATVDGSRPARAKLADALSAEGDVGKNFGLLTIGISGGGAVAPPAFGVVLGWTSIETVFGIIAGVGVLAVAMTLVVVSVGEQSLDGSTQPAK